MFELFGAVFVRAACMSFLATKRDGCLVFMVINKENPASDRKVDENEIIISNANLA